LSQPPPDPTRRRPASLDDALLPSGTNEEPLPYDAGFRVRLLVPSWIGIASIRWVGNGEAFDRLLFSFWNVQCYRCFGPGHQAEAAGNPQ
jgi:DMSO/TMAO reductase YedYZ molybdopterin-dependent catalytic subunit